MISRYRNLLLLAIALLLQLFLLAYQLRRNRDVPVVRYAAVVVVTPFQKALDVTVKGTERIWWDYLDLRGARSENRALHRQLDSLKLETDRLREQAAEYQSLQAVLDLRRQIPSATAVAQVIGASSSDTARMITIDKGAREGLQPDMAVLVTDGVVGKVLHVFPEVSQVLLLTDPYSGVACLLKNSRVHGVLKGLNKPVCSLDYISNGDPVKPGDQVITSGEDQIYPKGLPVGTVVSVRPGPEFQQITVVPSAQLDRVDQVLVFLSHPTGPIPGMEIPEGPSVPGTKAATTMSPSLTEPSTRAAVPAPAPAAATSATAPGKSAAPASAATPTAALKTSPTAGPRAAKPSAPPAAAAASPAPNTPASSAPKPTVAPPASPAGNPPSISEPQGTEHPPSTQTGAPEPAQPDNPNP